VAAPRFSRVLRNAPGSPRVSPRRRRQCPQMRPDRGRRVGRQSRARRIVPLSLRDTSRRAGCPRLTYADDRPGPHPTGGPANYTGAVRRLQASRVPGPDGKLRDVYVVSSIETGLSGLSRASHQPQRTNQLITVSFPLGRPFRNQSGGSSMSVSSILLSTPPNTSIQTRNHFLDTPIFNASQPLRTPLFRPAGFGSNARPTALTRFVRECSRQPAGVVADGTAGCRHPSAPTNVPGGGRHHSFVAPVCSASSRPGAAP
jgi:hypothetical protein